MRRIITLAAKDLLLLLKDPAAVFFALLFPMVLAIVMGMIFAGESGSDEADAEPTIAVALVDEDRTDDSSQFRTNLSKNSFLDVRPFESFDNAKRELQRGNVSAAIRVPSGFGENAALPLMGGSAVVDLAVDPSRFAEAGMIRGVTMEAGFQVVEARIRAMFPGGGAREAGESGESGGGASFRPFDVRRVPALADDELGTNRGPNSFAISFPQGIAWAVLGCMAAFSISIVNERRAGTWRRLQMTPASLLQLLLGKGAACFVAIALISTTLLLIGRFGFDVRAHSVFAVAGSIVSISLAFVGVSTLLSSLAKTEAAANGVAWSAAIAMSLVGGGMVPLFLLPKTFQTIGLASPVRWAVITLERATWRTYDPAALLSSCGVLVAIGVVTFTIGALVHRRFDRN